MYTHARQFPHLAGMSDPDIRELARRAMSRRPNLIRIWRIRTVVVLIAMAAGAVAMKWAGMRLGTALMVAGGTATAALVAWNAVWLNTILFRVTNEEREGQIAP